MQIAVDDRAIVAEGHKQSRQFGLKPTAHLMQVLSGLYSNIPWAIVREYATNMLDGYTKLLRENPDATIRAPEIHIPSLLAPFIEFKDFGAGMPFGTVWEVFTEYGASTKRDNNEEVGGLGIGAKTAFCYEPADPWIIESRFGGERMVFHAAKDDQHIPTLHHVGTFETNEQNGVTVKIPVAVSDFRSFADAVRRLLAYFPMEVKVTGDPRFQYDKPEYRMQGDGWAVRRGQDSVVIMGNVPYPVPQNELILAGMPREVLNAYAIDLRVPIGAVDIVPSREALKYTPRTQATLKTCIKHFFAQFREFVQKNIQEAPTKWDALLGLYEAEGITALHSQLRGITWRGEKLDLVDGVMWQYPARLTAEQLAQGLKPSALVPTAINLDALFPGIIAESYSNERNKQAVAREIVHRGKLTPTKNKLWVMLNDLPTKGLVERIRQYMRSELDLKKGRRYSYHGDYGTAYVFFGDGITPEALSAALGGVPVMRTSELPVPYIAPRNQTRTKTQAKHFDHGEWEPIEVTEEDGGYYVRLQGANEVIDVPQGEYFLRSLWSAAIDMELLPEGTRLYGIPRTLKRLEKQSQWKEFVPTIQPLAKKVVIEGKRVVAEAEVWQPILNSKLLRLVHGLEREHLQGDLALLYDKAEAAKDLRETANNVRTLAQLLQMAVPTVKPSYDAAALFERIKKRYPMLDVVANKTSYLDEDEKEAVYNYLNGSK